MPAWPGTLPVKPLEQGYEETLRQSQERSQIEGLPIVQRQRSSAYAKPMAVTFQLTSAQIDILSDFFIDDLGHGAITFTWTHPRTGSAIRSRFVGGNVPEYSAVGYNTYRAACVVEMMP